MQSLANVEPVVGDALNLADVSQAMKGQVAAIVSTIGGLPQDGQRSDFWGNKQLIDAAVAAGVQRFVLVSSLGAGETKNAIPAAAYESLAEVLAEKEKAENYLMASGLRYTVIRPGGLKSEPATGNGVLTLDTHVAGSICRADVADLVCRCLAADQAEGKVLSAFDRTMTFLLGRDIQRMLQPKTKNALNGLLDRLIASTPDEEPRSLCLQLQLLKRGINE